MHGLAPLVFVTISRQLNWLMANRTDWNFFSGVHGELYSEDFRSGQYSEYLTFRGRAEDA
jgi:hypothetical protein